MKASDMRKYIYLLAALTLVVIMAWGVGKHYVSYAASERFYNSGGGKSQRKTEEPLSDRIEPVHVIEYGIEDGNCFETGYSSDNENHFLYEEKGNSIPTQFWNLSVNTYQFSINNMHQYVYTNYYFAPDSNCCIAMSMGTLNSGGNNVTINMYETTNNICVASWTGNPQSIVGLGWTNLNPNKFYYFKFMISSGTLSGGGTVLHD